MATFKAIVFILKSLIDLGMYFSQMISRAEYHKRLNQMDDAVYQASNGELGKRLEGGRQVEDQINQHAPKGPKP